MTEPTKCDFCDKPMTSYGSYQCYMACDDHVKDGEALEDKMWASIQDSDVYPDEGSK